MRDRFFESRNCGRCSKPIRRSGFTMSWFVDVAICMECSDEESALKAAMRKQGMDPSEYEGCGYVPKLSG